MADEAHLRRVYSVVCGACFIAITQLATREKLTGTQLIALGCFVTAMPFFALEAGVPRLEYLKKGSLLSHLVSYLSGFALPIFWIGVAALTFSFRWWVGLFFVASSGIAWAIAHVTLEKKPDSN